MKYRLIALAALAATGSAHALSPADVDGFRTAGTLKEVRIGGASAMRLFIGSYMQEICNPTTFDVFFDGSSGSNWRSYSCKLKAKTGNWLAGTPILVTKRDKDGSLKGVIPVADSVAIEFMHTGNANCTRTANPTPVTDILKASYSCTTTSLDMIVPEAGVSDVEPNVLLNTINGGDGVARTSLDIKATNLSLMGVPVTKTLYRALQEQQGIIAPGGAMIDVPADQTTWTDADKATIPSLPREFIASAMAGKLSGSSSTKPGWEAVISTTVDANVKTKQVNVCRRDAGSGTQAAAQLFFLNMPSKSSVAAPTGESIAPAPAQGALAVTGTFAVDQQSGTGALISACLTPMETAGAYAIGSVSRENNPRANGGNASYRFVKVSGQIPHPAEAQKGQYEYLYAATMQFNKVVYAPTTDIAKFIVNLRNTAGTPASLSKFDIDNKVGYLALPSSYTGLYSNSVDPNVLTYGSRVQRISTPVPNNVTPLTFAK